MQEDEDAHGPLRAHRVAGGDVEVEGSGSTAGWRFRVYAADRSVRVIPPADGRVNRESWRAIPIGAVLRSADEVLATDRLDDVMKRVPRLRRLRAPEQRDQQIASAYRQALLAGVPPRAVVARLLDVREDRAGREIARLRKAGLIDAVHDERRRAIAEAAR